MGSNSNRVVILGGGMAGFAAAWELTRRDPTVEVDIYEHAGVPGGKCASVRNADPRYGRRVEEHGLHVLMGFYDQVLYILKETYAEVATTGDAAKVRRWEDALRAVDELLMADLHDGGWRFWKVRVPANRRPVGDRPRIASNSRMYDDGMQRYERDRRILFQLCGKVSMLTNAYSAAVRLPILLLRLLDHPFLTRIALVRAIRQLLAVPLRSYLVRSTREAWAAAEPLLKSENPASALGISLRRKWIGVWFAGANLIGMAADGILSGSATYRDLDRDDYKDWLVRHAPVRTKDEYGRNSPIVQAFYDLAFSHPTTLGAGASLRVLLRMATDYKGHVAYKMRGGMGDIVFAPLHYCLKNRKRVRVHYYHELKDVTLDRSGTAVDEIVLESRQPGAGSFGEPQPIDTAEGRMWCWLDPPPPAEQPTPVRLKAGKDFRVAVLAVPSPVLRTTCTELQRNERFRRNVCDVGAIATQCAQVWLDVPIPQKTPPFLISFAHPFNSWANMHDTLAVEPWGANGPKSLSYFAEPLLRTDFENGDPIDFVRGEVEGFRGELRKFLTSFDWSVLHDPDGRVGRERLRAQYFRANTEPESLYVLAESDTARHRLAQGESGFTNLAVAGDWTLTDISAGCVEAAAESGRLAAAAILEGKVHE